MTRTALPPRRVSVTFSMGWDPSKAGNPFPVEITVGFNAAGTFGEVFVNAGKSGEQLEAAARDGAILLSIALQSGASLPEIAKAITRDDFGVPASLIGAVIDAVAKEFL